LGLPPLPPPQFPGPPPIIPEGNGVFRLPTAQPIFNDPLGNPLGTCPPRTHYVLGKCMYDDANVRCPSGTHLVGIDRCVPTPPVEKHLDPDGSCRGVYEPISNKCYQDSDHAPPCPDGSSRYPFGICQSSRAIQYVTFASNEKCLGGGGGVHVTSRDSVCFVETSPLNPDGSCESGYFSTGGNCKLRIHDPLPDGTCPAGYSNIPAPNAPVPRGTLCKLNELKLTNDDVAYELPGGYCPIGYHRVPSDASTRIKCVRNS
jgi:hypothetical protein